MRRPRKVFAPGYIFDWRLPSQHAESRFLAVGCDITVYQTPELPVLSVKDQNICWCKNLATKGEQGQLRWRTQDTGTDVWCLTKHPSNLICMSGTGKVFDFGECGQKGGKGGEGEETYTEAEGKTTGENRRRLNKPCQHGRKSHKLVKCPSGEVARVLFPWSGSVQPHLEETSVNACPVCQVCQSW